ncbi:hypothetical protein [Saccharothrix sp. ST-888]|uniref:hypothetical protein n=1 Tax=Saccharothrix sp. ST-888 TaxID=1427391 RepID=UPI0005ED0BD9|nr:hypothetical protein [Saccharothrix sp. ST-888]KJK57990.1 hypothetical protein UK12_13025 [Saccharothrix sp. ST-888]
MNVDLLAGEVPTLGVRVEVVDVSRVVHQIAVLSRARSAAWKTGGPAFARAGRMVRMFQYAIAEFPAVAGAMAAAPAVAAAFDGARS